LNLVVGEEVVSKVNTTILSIAFLWAVVLLALAYVMKGSSDFPIVLLIVGGGVGATIVLLGGGMRRSQ
jgi:hypothetical protein